jgi:hypothetical protein
LNLFHKINPLLKLLYIVFNDIFLIINILIYIVLICCRKILKINYYVPLSIGSIPLGIISFLLVFYFNATYNNYLSHYDLICSFKHDIIKLMINNKNKTVKIYEMYLFCYLYFFRNRPINKQKDLIYLNKTIDYSDNKIIYYLDKFNSELNINIDNVIDNVHKIDTKKELLVNLLYKYLMKLLIYIYLPIFSIVVVFNIEFNNSINDIYMIIIGAIIIVIINIYYMGSITFSMQMADPYGDDILDLDYNEHLKEIIDIMLYLSTENIPKNNDNKINIEINEVNKLFSYNYALTSFIDQT